MTNKVQHPTAVEDICIPAQYYFWATTLFHLRGTTIEDGAITTEKHYAEISNKILINDYTFTLYSAQAY